MPDLDPVDRYRRETEPDAAATARLVRRARAPRRSSPGRGWLLLPAALTLTAAGWLLLPAAPPADAPPPEPVALWSPDTPRVTPAGDGIELSWQGTGELGDHHLAWEAGEVSVEVPPDRGLTFTVETREATVRVVGTGFSVRRDALGTTVDVRHGRVAVRCGEESPDAERLLGVGEHHTCAPISASGLLARARALRGSTPAEARVAVERGLAASPSPAVEVELRYLRAELALAAGDSATARTDLDAVLSAGASARHDDATRQLLALAVAAGECDRARALGATLSTPAALGGCEPGAPE